MGKRVGVFIDVQNVYYSAKNFFNGKLNYTKLLDILKEQGNDICIARVYLLTKKEIETASFEMMLEKNGYDIRRKFMEFKGKDDRRTNNVNWEIGMAIDMIEWSKKLDKIVLVTGNGIFEELINYIKHTVSVEIAFFKESTSIGLMRNADKFMDLSEYKNSGIILEEFKKEDADVKKEPDKKLNLDGEDEDEVQKVNAAVDKAKTKNGMGVFG